jgi:electron transfer flavoprotein beta subunit
MNLYVCIKQVPDTETKIKLSGDNNSVDLAGAKFIMSPFDEFAVEEALRVKEKNAGSTVTVVSAGPARVAEALRTALAMGCDNAIHVDTPESADNFLVAKALAATLGKEATKPDIIYFGKEAIDDGSAQVTQLVSEAMSLPCVTVVLGIEYGSGTLKCRREVEGGAIEVVETSTPALIAAQKGMNEPRYASLPNIMKAKKKEIKVLKLADIGVAESEQKIRFKNFQMPPPKQAGRKIDGDAPTQAKALVSALHTEAKVV